MKAVHVNAPKISLTLCGPNDSLLTHQYFALIFCLLVFIFLFPVISSFSNYLFNHFTLQSKRHFNPTFIITPILEVLFPSQPPPALIVGSVNIRL